MFVKLFRGQMTTFETLYCVQFLTEPTYFIMVTFFFFAQQ